MPEGPEIKRAADRLSAILNGEHARLVEFAFPHLSAAARTLSGQKIVSVKSRGKALITTFANDNIIYSHNQLYGEWHIYARAAIKPQQLHATKQVRLVLHTDTHAAVLYSASDISLWHVKTINSHPYIAKLGLELLDAAVMLDDVIKQISQVKFRNKSLADLLLRQDFLAGLGNYLRSEILFVAKIPVNARLCDLNPTQQASIATAALTLTRQSYETDGITNDINLAIKLKAEGWRYGRYRHWVFDRAGEACHACASVIARVDIGDRGVYFCPKCQVK
jgi:endonuclease-8